MINFRTLNDTAIAVTMKPSRQKPLQELDRALRLPGPTELIQVMQHRSPLRTYLSCDLALSYQGEVLK